MTAPVVLLALFALYFSLGCGLVRWGVGRSEGRRMRVWWEVKGDRS